MLFQMTPLSPCSQGLMLCGVFLYLLHIDKLLLSGPICHLSPVCTLLPKRD